MDFWQDLDFEPFPTLPGKLEVQTKAEDAEEPVKKWNVETENGAKETPEKEQQKAGTESRRRDFESRMMRWLKTPKHSV